MIDISGLEKTDVLCALYDRARPVGMGFLHYRPEPLSPDEAKRIVQDYSPTLYFDYLKGRVMKCCIAGDDLSPRLYDHNNGNGAAAEAIANLREKLSQRSP